MVKGRGAFGPALFSSAACRAPASVVQPHRSRVVAYTPQDSGAAKLGWIIDGRRVVVKGPQATRNGGIANKPLTTRSDEGWGRSLAGTNNGIARFGRMPSCSGVRRSTQSDQKAHRQDRTHRFCSMSSPRPLKKHKWWPIVGYTRQAAINSL